ncbi:unnamed protein product [Microthlaspi erraticum]|uniref:Chromo domain-containing protein n=1 Tax=Microthlaspi erraticum TaxID=1685480 RepID=A0A6D2KDB3_9BRAS|nr:unnamed protein product [Microthlaspi erraticum]CAA7049739.1 unnamed protein product [Microthlaspi erraticum]
MPWVAYTILTVVVESVGWRTYEKSRTEAFLQAGSSTDEFKLLLHHSLFIFMEENIYFPEESIGMCQRLDCDKEQKQLKIIEAEAKKRGNSLLRNGKIILAWAMTEYVSVTVADADLFVNNLNVAEGMKLARASKKNNYESFVLRGSVYDVGTLLESSVANVVDGLHATAAATVLHYSEVGALELLIKWSGYPEAERTWVHAKEFSAQYPDFQLEDKLVVKEGGIDKVAQIYFRRIKWEMSSWPKNEEMDRT